MLNILTPQARKPTWEIDLKRRQLVKSKCHIKSLTCSQHLPSICAIGEGFQWSLLVLTLAHVPRIWCLAQWGLTGCGKGAQSCHGYTYRGMQRLLTQLTGKHRYSIRMGFLRTCWSPGGAAVWHAEKHSGGEAVDRAEDLTAMSEPEDGEMDWVRPWQ